MNEQCGRPKGARQVNRAKRQALGANPSGVIGMIVWHLSVPIPIGIGIGFGIVIGLAASRVLASFLYEITPQDSVTHIAASGLLLAVALLAALLPARRAARIMPMEALRNE